MIDTKALRQKILDMAIKGKLVPQDPNDEPASVLLEHIRAEKQQLIKEGKIKKDKNDSVIFKGADNRYYEKVGSEVKDITDDLPFEIPDSWVWTRFSTLIQIISGVSYDKKDVATKGIRILRGGNINDLKVSLFSDDVFLPETYYDPDKQIQIDDVLIVASTGSKEVIGKAGYVIEPLVNTQIGAFLRIVRPILKWYAPYVKLIFATEYYREHIRHLSGGTNINNIKADYINALIISLPPYAEQIRIAERINSLFEQINIIEQSQTDTDTLYKEFIKRTLTLAIQGKLVPQDPNDEPANVLLERIRAEKKAKLGKKYVDSYIYKSDDNCYYEKVGTNEPVRLDNLPFDIPDSWCWARLGNIGDWGAGATPARTNSQYYGGNIPWLKTGELNNDIIYGSEEHITDEALKECSLRYCRIGDVLIAMYGATIGKLAIAGVPLTTNQACCACTPYEGIYNFYLFYFLMEEKDNFTQMGFGGAQPNISKEKIIKHLFPVPPYEEQKEIVSTFISIQNILKDEN